MVDHDLQSTIPRDYSYNGRLDFQGTTNIQVSNVQKPLVDIPTFRLIGFITAACEIIPA